MRKFTVTLKVCFGNKYAFSKNRAARDQAAPAIIQMLVMSVCLNSHLTHLT